MDNNNHYQTVHERVVMARMMRALRSTVLYRAGLSEYELRIYQNAKIVLLCMLFCALMVIFSSFCQADCIGDCKTIAIILSAEDAQGGKDGMEAIASSMLNRSKAWNKSIINVATQKNQYYGLTAKNRLKRYKEVKPIADRIAKDLLSGKLKDSVNGGLYFRTNKEKMFKWCKIETARRGSHIFYR